ncbi:hypothetical protein [Mesobacillus zeae]|uniref:Uncharacterized protein n=1 Tax=Mesobacillus zeae TaxID=1917180 RepID=A0A398B654_9BACI|nr:hypothetical protein [Mesobacillus zeae]RID85031.1 hypothetical protein D1970_10715 [Mesobacillus zeae]
MSLKDEFLKTEDPQKISDMLKTIPKKEWDKEMVTHLNNVVRKSSNGETQKNHSDPRAAFRKRR